MDSRLRGLLFLGLIGYAVYAWRANPEAPPPPAETAVLTAPAAPLPAVEITSGTGRPQGATEARTYFEEGQRLVKEGTQKSRFGEAAARFRLAAQADSSEGAYSYYIGFALYQAGDPLAAAAELKNTVARFPRLVPAYQLLGMIQYEQGRVDEAIPTLEAGLRLDPADIEMQRVLQRARGETNFTQETSISFDFYYKGPRTREFELAKNRISRELDLAYVRVGRQILFEPKDRIQVLFYDPADFSSTLAPDAWVGGLFDGKIRIPLTDFEREQARVRSVVYHEYTHAIVYRLSPVCPVWLNEGLAQLMEEKDLAAAQRRLQGAVLLPSSRLSRSFMGLSSAEAVIAYDMSFLLTHHLKMRCGLYAIVEFLKELEPGSDLDALFQKHFLKSYEDLFADFKKGVRR